MKHFYLFFIILFSAGSLIFPQTKQVFIVLGSDTGIWDGMNTNEYVCTYNVSLFSSPNMNAANVMDASFRNSLRDSYNNTLKYTWWMMGGNLFRYATNKNMPQPNIMVPYLMKHFYGDKVALFGDELTLHYHDWDWTDYSNDGNFMWNQATQFMNVKEDFDFTLAQLLLEENIFPVSFRSGWHAMDNGWQNYLNELLPYSLHNDYPARHIDTIAPIDNVYDWSQSSAEFVPFHPSDTNYQKAGNLSGYNTRSIYMSSMSQSLLNSVFSKANNGVNQVVTLWAHLPEVNFLDNTRRVDSILHKAALLYPNVKFKYCTAVEAMQLWRNSQDTTKPILTIQEVMQGENVLYNITSSKQIFQKVPFAAIKTLDYNFSTLPVIKTGVNTFQTTLPVKKADIAKVGFSVTDTLGNQTNKIINYYPDDIFIDNKSPNYIEQKGNWSSLSNTFAWDNDYRKSTSDTASIRCNINVAENAHYNIYLQPNENITSPIKVKIYKDNILVDSAAIDTLYAKDWNFITSKTFESGKTNYIVLEKTNAGSNLNFDVLKISALVPFKKLLASPSIVNLNNVIQNDTTNFNLSIDNTGRETITIDNVQTSNGYVQLQNNLPITFNVGERKNLSLIFTSNSLGQKTDTVIFYEGATPRIRIAVNAIVQKYFNITDNEDTLNYFERGAWAKSNAQAWGGSSRYASLNSVTTANASFFSRLKLAGYYDILQIVPNTVNAVDATYKLKIGNQLTDSVTIDQNLNSGSWVKLFHKFLPAEVPIEVIVSYAHNATTGNVLRADAVKFQFIDATNSVSSSNIFNDFELLQNYPNPFNPSTTIKCKIQTKGKYTLKVYNVLGQEAAVITSQELEAGEHTFTFDGTGKPSGIYIYQLLGININISKKMILLK